MTHLYEFADLEMLARDCLTRAGVGEREARCVARDVALAEYFGEAESGFAALLRDIRLIRYGRLHLGAPVAVSTPAPAILRIDAGHGFAAPALARALPLLRDACRREGMAMIHLTRSSDPGAMAGALLDLAEQGLAAVAARSRGVTFAIRPGGGRILPIAGSAPGMIDAILSLAPPPDDSPLDGPVSCSAWLTALDPGLAGTEDFLAEMSTRGRPTGSGIAVAPELLAQIVNA